MDCRRVSFKRADRRTDRGTGSRLCRSPAHHRHHHHYVHRLHIPWFSYLHNYGPGPLPGTWAYYDGPTSVRCKQSAAAYRGQDGRRHPCH